MTALAAATATPLVAPAVSAHAAPTAQKTAQKTAAAGKAAQAASTSAAGGGSVAVAAHDAAPYSAASLGALTTEQLAGTPARTKVMYAGTELAVLTAGARTVRMRGPERTFREDKALFTEDFARTTTAKWGTSPRGGVWSHANGVDADFFVTPGAGVIRLTSAQPTTARHATLLDGRITDVDVRSTARFSAPATGAALSYALSFGYQGVDDHYRARLSFTEQGNVDLRLEKQVAGNVTVLAGPFTLDTAGVATDDWTIRVQREGSQIRARAWKSSRAENPSWTAQATDASFPEGRVGLRTAAGAGYAALPVELRVKEFAVTSGRWAEPVTVTHRDWIRVLEQPYDGQWSTSVERQIRAWAGSTAPDALAYASMYLAGAPDVTSGVAGTQEFGKRVLGEARYGAVEDGSPVEGADFHEFMGVKWTFPDGRVWNAESRFLGCLDCSGYVRIVYGHHLGIPMAHYDEAPDGVRLPRTSDRMANSAPGARIAHSATAQPPAAPQLQTGDLVFFDAESATSAIDHVGIYLGLDQAGQRRFLSSRKSGNGPTAADVGGASTLDGDGLYARTLRTVHRL